MKKYIFSFALSLLLFLAVKIASNNTSPSIQIVINTPSLCTYQITENISTELSKIKGVSYYEFSLPSKSALINYDHKKVDGDDIIAAFNKWGCENYEISYNPIF